MRTRIAQHKSDSQKRNANKTIPFYNAINKYGFDNIQWEIIDNYDDKEEGNQKEIKWITELKTYIHFSDCRGYNATLGGNSRAELTCLNDQELINIGDEYREGYSAKELAQKYNVPLWTMQAIFRGEQWADYTKIKPRLEYIPHATIFSSEQVDEILELYKQEGNITHVANDFKNKYHKGSKSSIRKIIMGETWSEYTGITSKEFFQKYLQKDNRPHIIKQRIINQEIADEIRLIYS